MSLLNLYLTCTCTDTHTHTVGVRDSDLFMCAFQIPADSTLQFLVPGNVLHRVFSVGSQSLPSRTHSELSTTSHSAVHAIFPGIYLFLHHRRETKKAWRFNQLDPVLISGYHSLFQRRLRRFPVSGGKQEPILFSAVMLAELRHVPADRWNLQPG